MNNTAVVLAGGGAEGCEAVIKLLVEWIDVEADSEHYIGLMPLSYAAARGHKAVVKTMVKQDDVEAPRRLLVKWDDASKPNYRTATVKYCCEY